MLGTRNLYDINNLLSYFSKSFLFIFLLSNSAYPFLVLFIPELLSYILLSHNNYYLSFYALILSSSTLLSSIFIFSRYFYIPFSINNNLDFLLIFILFPILLIIFLLGIQFFSPIYLFFSI